MKAFYFGEREKALFGAYHPSLARKPRDAGVVLCYPFGYEYIKSHRAFRHLAKQLSQSGFHVLRFDYFGTGDSSGDAQDGSVPQWLEDISIAVAELRDMASVRRICLVGFRLGSTLAAVAASRLREVDALALWDPIVRGEALVNELVGVEGAEDQTPAAYCFQPGAECATLGIKGFPLSDEMIKGMAGLDLLAIPDFGVGRIAVVASKHREEYELLMHHLGNQRAPATYRCVESAVTWDAADGFSSAVLLPEVQECVVSFLEDALLG